MPRPQSTLWTVQPSPLMDNWANQNLFYKEKYRLKFRQYIAYLNIGIYPFTSIVLVMYYFLLTLSFFFDQFIVQFLDIAFPIYLIFFVSLLMVKWTAKSVRHSTVTNAWLKPNGLTMVKGKKLIMVNTIQIILLEWLHRFHLGRQRK